MTSINCEIYYKANKLGVEIILFDKVDIAFGAFFLIMLAIGILRISILNEKYGKNKSYFISSLLTFLLALPCALYGLYEADKLYGKINYGALLLLAAMGNILFALFHLKFRGSK